MEKITQIEYTKKSLLERVNNIVIGYRTYAVYFKAYVDEYRYMKLKKIVRIFDDDILEYYDYEKEYLTKKEINACINEFIYSAIDYTDNDIFETRNLCNETINEYNAELKY